MSAVLTGREITSQRLDEFRTSAWRNQNPHGSEVGPGEVATWGPIQTTLAKKVSSYTEIKGQARCVME